MSVPIGLSPGRSGFGPQLSIAYDSGSGNGPFGLGWKPPIPSVARKTDKGLPRYRDAEESDVFILSGAEDLVPLLDPLSRRRAPARPARHRYTSHPGRAQRVVSMMGWLCRIRVIRYLDTIEVCSSSLHRPTTPFKHLHGMALRHPPGASAARQVLHRAPNGGLPAEQEEVMTTKRAPVGLQEPQEAPLHGIPWFCSPKLDGSAMWALRGGEPDRRATHGPTSVGTAPLASGPARFGAGPA
ncbi:MAG: SpvB/TcaC N-terminal domain-containing protein [Candidatus Solibacter sp.]